MGTDEAPQDRRFRIGDLGELETAAAIIVALAQQAPGRRDGRAEAVAADVDVALHRRIRIDGRALGSAETTDRKSVVYGKSGLVRVDLGGRRINKQKSTKKRQQT